MHMVIILGDYAVQEISMALKYIAKVDILNIFLARAGSLLSLSFQDTRKMLRFNLTCDYASFWNRQPRFSIIRRKLKANTSE